MIELWSGNYESWVKNNNYYYYSTGASFNYDKSRVPASNITYTSQRY